MNTKLRDWAATFSIASSAISELLGAHGGVHAMVFGYHRSLSKRFPFAIYYRVNADVVPVRAILDCRSNPSWLRRRLPG